MPRRKQQVHTAPETPQVASEPTIMVNGVAMTVAQIQALAASHAALTQQAQKQQENKPEWYGGFNAFAKGTMTKPYGDKPGHPSPKGYVQLHTVKGVHPSSLNALPKSPSGLLSLAMLLCDVAEALIDHKGQFEFDDYVQEHWAEITARFGE